MIAGKRRGVIVRLGVRSECCHGRYIFSSFWGDGLCRATDGRLTLDFSSDRCLLFCLVGIEVLTALLKMDERMNKRANLYSCFYLLIIASYTSYAVSSS